MFNIFKDFLGVVYVREDVDTILIGGINVNKFKADIQSIWGSIKVLSNMFVSESKYSVVVNKFYAVDILYMTQQIHLYKKSVSNKYRIGKMIELLLSETWLRSLEASHPDILDYSKTSQMLHQPLPHQEKFLQEYNRKVPRMKLNGFLLAADVGTGKTNMSLYVSACTDSEVVIIISPKSILDRVWVDAIYEEFGDKASVWSVTRNDKLETGYKYYVANYEYLDKLVKLTSYVASKPSTIIIDECHNFNDPTSLRSVLLARFCKQTNCKNIIFASGTAVKAMGYEMITLLRCIDPLFTKDSEERFKKIYGISAKRAVDVLRHRLDMVGHKIPKSEVMKIPPPIVSKLKVKLPNSNRFTVETVKQEMKVFIEERIKFYAKDIKAHNEFFNHCLRIHNDTLRTSKQKEEFKRYLDYINIIKKGYDPRAHKTFVKYCNDYEKQKIIPSLPANMRNKFKDVKSIIKYVELKVLGEALGGVLGKRRSECHSEMIKYSGIADIVNNADKKTICFTSSVDVVKAADQYFRENDFDPRLVYGETNKDVGSIINEFKTDPQINPLIATYPSLSVGVTLINANICILLDLPMRQYMWEQAVHRIFRIGQDTQTYVYECTLDTGTLPNISTRAEDIMLWSKEQVDAILGRNVPADEAIGIIHNLSMNPETRFERAVKKFQKLFS